jgi:hypothetical protein
MEGINNRDNFDITYKLVFTLGSKISPQDNPDGWGIKLLLPQPSGCKV